MDKQRALGLLDNLERALGVAEGLVALGRQEFHGDIRNRYALRMAIVEIVEAAAALGLCSYSAKTSAWWRWRATRMSS